MDFTSQFIFGIGALLVVSVLASRISERFDAPLLLVFLLLGMLMGAEGLGLTAFIETELAFLAASLALAVILFDGGLRTEYSIFRLGLRPALLLATFGVIVTAGITGAAAVLLFDVSLLGGLLIGAIVGSTDAAAVFYLLHANGLQINERLRSTLEIESGSNDPMAVFLTVSFIALMQAEGAPTTLELVGSFIWQMGMGAVIGGVAGVALASLVNRVALAESLYPILVLAAGLTIFGLAGTIGSSGFLAAYVGGVVAGNRMRYARHEVRQFHDGIAWMAQAGLFLILGVLVVPSELLPLAPAALVLAVVLIGLARPIAVALSLTPFGFPWREQAFISWVGLRGAVPIVLGLYPVMAGTADGRLPFNVAFFVVLISLIVQGWTVAPAARWLGVQLPRRALGKRLIELDAPGLKGRELIVFQVDAGARAAGMRGRDLPLPPESRLIAIVRGDRLLDSVNEHILAANDHVYLLARSAEAEELETVFGREPEETAEHAFFGAFTLHGSARAGEVAAFYGVELDGVDPDRTLDEHVRERFGHGVAVGDRVALGTLDLTVRAVNDGRVTRVGLQPRAATPADTLPGASRADI